jgi:hypothetical protein
MSTNSKVPDVKQSFEAALATLNNDSALPIAEGYRMVLRQQTPLREQTEGHDFFKKRALNDAAVALSLLWNQRTHRR